jgi:hypothetical protein
MCIQFIRWVFCFRTPIDMIFMSGGKNNFIIIIIVTVLGMYAFVYVRRYERMYRMGIMITRNNTYATVHMCTYTLLIFFLIFVSLLLKKKKKSWACILLLTMAY